MQSSGQTSLDTVQCNDCSFPPSGSLKPHELLRKYYYGQGYELTWRIFPP